MTRFELMVDNLSGYTDEIMEERLGFIVDCFLAVVEESKVIKLGRLNTWCGVKSKPGYSLIRVFAFTDHESPI